MHAYLSGKYIYSRVQPSCSLLWRLGETSRCCARTSCAAQFRARVRGARTDPGCGCSRGPWPVAFAFVFVISAFSDTFPLARDHLRSNPVAQWNRFVDHAIPSPPRDRDAELPVHSRSFWRRREGSRRIKDAFEGE